MLKFYPFLHHYKLVTVALRWVNFICTWWINSIDYQHAVYEKIRAGRQVQNMAVAVVVGLDEAGRRDILAVEPMYEESEATYHVLFEKLKERGLKNVWLVVSDAHKGLANAVQKSFVGCSWQRCKVHFMRNILAHVPAKGKAAFAEKLKQILAATRYGKRQNVCLPSDGYL